jgi:hypothetical protein
MLASAAAEIEGFLESRSAGGPEAIAEGRILEEALDRAREARRIARWDEQTGLTVDDELGYTAHARRDDGKTDGHRLEDRERKAFRPAR